MGGTLALDRTHALQRLEYTSVNERFNIRGQQKPPSNVVIVAIDDKTFEDLDLRWPFRRKYHAQVIRNLTEAGAKVIAYDVQFTEPEAIRSRTPPMTTPSSRRCGHSRSR